jgi:hypothetical protein
MCETQLHWNEGLNKCDEGEKNGEQGKRLPALSNNDFILSFQSQYSRRLLSEVRADR